MVKTERGFIPADDAAKEETDRIHIGEEVMIYVVRGVNPALHRKVMALIRLMFQNQERYDSFKIFRYALLIKLGHCKTVILPDGMTLYIPDSMAFAKMDDSDRGKILNDIIDAAVAGKLVGPLDKEKILQVLDFS